MKILLLQAVKHLLVGAGATVIDLLLFEGFIGIIFFLHPLLIKTISFLISATIKYAGNKYWAFEQFSLEGLKRELIRFACITAIGITIDVMVFYYATSIMGAQFGLSQAMWRRWAVVAAAAVAALWNFSGYKFLVFKK